jgi:hypothetical protein
MKLDKPTEKIVLRFVLTAILLPVSWSSVPYGVSQSLPDTIDRVRSAVVRVVRECSYGMEVRRFGGTGFLVSEHTLWSRVPHLFKAQRRTSYCPWHDSS